MDVTVNGTAHPLDGLAAGATAVDLIRDGLGLTGTKRVCGQGVCGACTVLLDGVPVVSCLLPTAALAGRTVTTVEGLAGGDGAAGAHPVQRAFAAHDALQCGYCTPGFVVEAVAFVDDWRAEHGEERPDRETIAGALAGHLCRCGAYEGIYAAVAAACAGEHDPGPGSDQWAGARREAHEKVTGAATYTTDVRLEGQLEGRIVRSRSAHAVIGTLRSPDGVGLVDLLPADRTVRFVGQPVAAVAAPSRAEAEALAARVEVAYDERPVVLDTAVARRRDSPAVYETDAARKAAPSSGEGPGIRGKWHHNLRGPRSMSWRSSTATKRIAAARDGHDPRLVSASFTTAVQVHTALEPHACVARWDAAGDLHLHLSTQAVDEARAAAAKQFGLTPARVHVVAEHVGGGFGAKVSLTVETVAAAELARAYGSPVRVVLDRSEELTSGGNRPGAQIEIELLADAAGDLAAMTMDVHGDGGVSTDSGVAILGRFVYGRAPRRLRDYDIVTHQAPGTPFRGPGGPPMAWGLEQSVDEVAFRLGEDPIALRRRWDGNPKKRQLYDWAAALPVWVDRPATGSQTGRFRRGVGVASASWIYVVDPGTEVELSIEAGPDGAVVVARTATQDMGTGIRSVIGSVVAEALELPPERVRVEVGRTGTVHGPTSGGSRTTTSVAPAAADAARQLAEKLGGQVLTRLDESVGVRVVGKRKRDRRGFLTPSLGGLALGRGLSGAVHVTEVEVDTRLGHVRATRVWAGIAAGRIYAEQLARSQCEGSVVQGVGFALYEQRHTDPSTGIVLTDNLEDYRIPGIGDTPEIEVHFHQEGWDHVPGGGVGLGEVGTMGVAASVGNAVRAATGWRPLDLPLRPDRLLEGMRS